MKKQKSEGELSREGVIAKYATTAADGKSYQVEYFNIAYPPSLCFACLILAGFSFFQSGIFKNTHGRALL